MSRSLVPQIIALRDRGLSKRQVAEALGIRYEALKSTTHRAGIEFGRPAAVVAAAAAKVCAHCGQPFTRRRGEDNTAFQRRVTCGTACGGILAARTRAALRGRGAYADQPWPAFGRPGELAPNAFAAHEIEPPPEYGSLPHRAVDRTLGGVVSYGGRGAA